MSEPRTCGNCDTRQNCQRIALFSPGLHCCGRWQPIPEPVATTDAPEPDDGGRPYTGSALSTKKQAVTRCCTDCGRYMYYRENDKAYTCRAGEIVPTLYEAIAKRDDLIRRFLQHDENVKTLTYSEWRQEERVLLADANEMMGVK